MGARFLVLCLVATLLTGCDYTSGTPDSGKAQIVNDTQQRVLIYGCGAYDCRRPASRFRRFFNETYFNKFSLRADEETGWFNISRRGVPNVYLILRPNPPGHEDGPVNVEKQRLGCLPFVMPQYIEEGLVARVSEMVPCRKSYDEDAAWPPRR
jgi:hypothetical protein